MTAIKPQRCCATSGIPGVSSRLLMGFCSCDAFALQQGPRRRLLGRALRRSLTARRLATADAHLGDEARCVVGSLAAHLDVFGQRQALALRPFLQRRLRVGTGARLMLVIIATPEAPDDGARRLEAGVEEDGTEDRLHRVGEDGALGATAAAGLAVRQDEVGTQADGPGDPCARLATHQSIVAAGELTLAGRWEPLAQCFGDHEA